MLSYSNVISMTSVKVFIYFFVVSMSLVIFVIVKIILIYLFIFSATINAKQGSSTHGLSPPSVHSKSKAMHIYS